MENGSEPVWKVWRTRTEKVEVVVKVAIAYRGDVPDEIRERIYKDVITNRDYGARVKPVRFSVKTSTGYTYDGTQVYDAIEFVFGVEYPYDIVDEIVKDIQEKMLAFEEFYKVGRYLLPQKQGGVE